MCKIRDSTVQYSTVLPGFYLFDGTTRRDGTSLFLVCMNDDIPMYIITL